jgi:hypothetical protein
LAFRRKNKAKFLRKTPIFSLKNVKKSQKIAIITSIPDEFVKVSPRIRAKLFFVKINARLKWVKN